MLVIVGGMTGAMALMLAARRIADREALGLAAGLGALSALCASALLPPAVARAIAAGADRKSVV